MTLKKQWWLFTKKVSVPKPPCPFETAREQAALNADAEKYESRYQIASLIALVKRLNPISESDTCILKDAENYLSAIQAFDSRKAELQAVLAKANMRNVNNA